MTPAKTAHQWAVELTHQRISYGQFLEEQPDILDALKKAVFRAARDVIAEAQAELAYKLSEAGVLQSTDANMDVWVAKLRSIAGG